MATALKRLPVLLQPPDHTPRLFGRIVIPVLLDSPAFHFRYGAKHRPGVRRRIPDIVKVGLDQDPIRGTRGDQVFVPGRPPIDGRRE